MGRAARYVWLRLTTIFFHRILTPLPSSDHAFPPTPMNLDLLRNTQIRRGRRMGGQV